MFLRKSKKKILLIKPKYQEQIECLMNYGWRFVTLYRRQGSRPSPRKRNAKKAKWLSGEALQRAVKRSEKQRRKGKIYPFECRVSGIARREKNAFFSDQRKEIEENNRMGKTRNLEIPRDHFMQRWAR